MAQLTEEQKKQMEEQEREINAAISDISGGDSTQLTDQQITKLKALGELLGTKAYLTSVEKVVLNEIERRKQNDWKPMPSLPIRSGENYLREIKF